MLDPKLHPSKKGEPMHYSVGAIIKKDGKYLLLDRVNPPYGFACPAGHVDEWENKEQAIKREVGEETGLDVTNLHLVLEEEIVDNTCSRGIDNHHWYVFECEVEGKVQRNYTEAKSIGWYTPKEIKKLKLEKIWKLWLKKLKII